MIIQLPSIWKSVKESRTQKKKDVKSADPVELKKSKNDPVSIFIAEQNLADIQQLCQSNLVARLCKAISLLENQRDDALELEAKFSLLQADFDNQVATIRGLEEDTAQAKIFFADSVSKLRLSKQVPSDFSDQSYASVTRGIPTSSVLVAKCVDGAVQSEPLSVQAVEEMLDTPNSGLIPSHVRLKKKVVRHSWQRGSCGESCRYPKQQRVSDPLRTSRQSKRDLSSSGAFCQCLQSWQPQEGVEAS